MALAIQRGNTSQEPSFTDFWDHPQEKYRLLQGDAEAVLPLFPSSAVDMCITSPPYWGQRAYDGGSELGRESHLEEYVARLVRIFHEVRRVLRPEGSLFLNIGDTYLHKNLCGVPWHVAFALQNDGWVLRNSIIWDKVKGNPCNAKDKLRNLHEYVFHFVQQENYFYDVDAIRNPPGKPYYRDGKIVTPTGVSGAKYEQQIRRSTELTAQEKEAALEALADTLRKVERGEIADFRMVIRGTQRSTHSDSREFSGRANEIQARGFCILPYHKNGSKPGDVWHIVPEDEWRKDGHYAVFPVELCELPIKATCPQRGILLDPFVGTGTALVAALLLERRGIGIDTSPTYLTEAEKRLQRLTPKEQSIAVQRGLFE